MNLFEPQKALHEIQVGFVYCTVLIQRAFALFRFFRENVSLKRFLVSDLAGAGHFEPFLGTRVRFYLGHFYFFIFTPCRRPARAETYGAMWAIPLDGKRAAKL